MNKKKEDGLNLAAKAAASMVGEEPTAFIIRVSKMSRTDLEMAFIRLHHKCKDLEWQVVQLEAQLQAERYFHQASREEPS